MPRKRLGAFKSQRDLEKFETRKSEYTTRTESELREFMREYLGTMEFMKFERDRKKKKENK